MSLLNSTAETLDSDYKKLMEKYGSWLMECIKLSGIDPPKTSQEKLFLHCGFCAGFMAAEKTGQEEAKGV